MTRWWRGLWAAVFLGLGQAGSSAEAVQAASCQVWFPSAFGESLTDPGWTKGTKRLLFYRARFADSERDPVSKEEAEQSLRAASEIFERMSFGTFSVEWTMAPLLSLPHAGAHYQQAGFNALLSDVRMAAAREGLNYEEFDLDLALTEQVPGFPMGQAMMGARGALVHGSAPELFVHELGHNLGLPHANGWENSGPPVEPKNSPPYPSNVNHYGQPFLYDPASLVGSGDIRSPGRTVEYGDFFDLMGSGGGDFNPAFKARLHWLSKPQVLTVSTSGTYHLHAYDQGGLAAGQIGVIRLAPVLRGRGDVGYRYWLGYRSSTSTNNLVPQGLELLWVDEGEGYTTQLIDARPGTSQRHWDAPLPPGRTFSDLEAGLHVTPVRFGNDDRALWMEVRVEFDPEETSNAAPLLEIAATATQVPPGTTVVLEASATDPDGDDISIFWDFGDDTFGNGEDVVKSWDREGEYVVRCEASDGKGGIASRLVVIRVGTPATWRISGRVTDEAGGPLQGVRVHNGRVEGESGKLPDFAITETDSDGVYILSGLRNGFYDPGAMAYGYELARATGSVEVQDGDATGIDFIAQLLPTVSIVPSRPSIREGETAELVFTRTGPMDFPLAVDFRLGGTAGPGQDFQPFQRQSLTIPEGSRSASIGLVTLEDLDEEGAETLMITAVPAAVITNLVVSRDVTNEVLSHYPGWRPLVASGGETWFQTVPGFARSRVSTTLVSIEDGTPPGLQRISIVAETGLITERPRTTALVRIERLGSTTLPLEAAYVLDGTARNGEDYEHLPGTLTIPAGAVAANLEVVPIADESIEGTESIAITLLPRAAYMILQGETTLAIQEDEFNSSPQALAFASQWDGSTVMQLRGTSGTSYILESSTDLRQWTPVSTNELIFSPLSLAIPLFDEPRLYYRSRTAPSP